MILKFGNFINEAKKNKDEIVEILTRLFKDKISVKTTNMTQKGLYSMSGIMSYFKEKGLSSQNATDALYAYQNTADLKKDLKSISVKDYKNNTSNPYYYTSITKEEAEKIKEKIELDSKESSKAEIDKRAQAKKRAADISKKTVPAKKTAAKKTPAKSIERKTPAKRKTK
jgi:hypothetical protein